jgi:hypothetical protein
VSETQFAASELLEFMKIIFFLTCSLIYIIQKNSMPLDHSNHKKALTPGRKNQNSKNPVVAMSMTNGPRNGPMDQCGTRHRGYSKPQATCSAAQLIIITSTAVASACTKSVNGLYAPRAKF